MTPMLAKPTDLSDISGDVYVQPKLDGIRCLAGADTLERPYLISRYGNHFHMPHIAAEVGDILRGIGTDVVLDGEIYIHGAPLEDITRLLKRPGRVQFHVYDIADRTASFRDRLKKLKSFNNTKYVRKVKTKFVSSEHLSSIHEYYCSKNYEGTIIRDPFGLYQPGKRGNELRKYKTFMTAEFRVVDFKTDSKNRVVWQCETDTGGKFYVKPNGSDRERAMMRYIAHNYINKLYTVKFQNYTKYKIPRHATGVCFRNYE